MVAPGVIVQERLTGAVPTRIQRHDIIYMVCSPGSTFSGSYNVPTPIKSLTDFITKATANSPSQKYIDALYSNDPRATVNAIFVKPARRFVVTVGTVTVGQPFSLTVGSVSTSLTSLVTYTAVTGDTVQTVRNQLLTRLQALSTVLTATAELTANIEVVGKVNDLTLTLPTANVTITQTSAGTNRILLDYVNALQNTLTADNNYPSGIICQTEAFQTYTTNPERSLLITSMEAVAISNNCVGLIDPIRDSNSINVLNDRKLYGSPKGHLNYFAPYLTVNGQLVPPSCVVAAVWGYYLRTIGLSKSTLGTQKALVIDSPEFVYTLADSNSVNGEGLNLILNIAKSGYVIWGGRTISSDARYNFNHKRVIMNVINEAAEEAYLPFIGSNTRISQGTYVDIRKTGSALLFELWQEGALFGDTAEQAYSVISDRSNNTDDDYNAGRINVDLYAVLVNTTELVLVGTFNLAVGALAEN